MAKKRRSRKKPNNNNSIITLIIIIVILAIISVITAYFVLGDDEKQIPDLFEEIVSPENPGEEIKNIESIEEITVKTAIDGTWVSNYDGAMLTISGTTFSIEMPSVDASSKVSGRLAVEKTIVSFSNTSGNEACLGKEGHYNYSFIDGELMLNKIKDPCDSRSQRMIDTWFKL